MAGDSKGAHNVSKARAGKPGKVKFQDDRSTNKTYASGQRSTVNNAGTANGRVSGGTAPPAPRRTRVIDRTAVRTADEYYRSAEPAPTAQQAARGPSLGKLPPIGAPRRTHALPSGDLTVRSVDDVQAIVSELAERLQAGATKVTLFIMPGVDGLLRRTRAAFEMLVTREIITEEHYHEVTFKYAALSPEPSPLPPDVPVPESTVSVDDAGSQVDPLAFLNGDVPNPDDTPVDVSAGPVTEHTDPILRDGDDEGDFTPPSPAAAVTPEAPSIEAAPEAAPEAATGNAPEATARGRGRRKQSS